jgi:hypothetical protein
MDKSFTDVLKKQKTSSIERQSRRSEKWFKNKLKSFAKDRRKGIASKPTIGKLYTYVYSPKYKKTLPHWDMFPLVMPVGIYPNGWLGMNFHYLPPRLRARLFDNIIKISGNRVLNENTKLKLTYNMLMGASANALVAPTIHRYLIGHVKSKIAIIPAEDWEYALTLPFAKFVGASNASVYKLAK